jgi:hypothetical protein
MIHALLIGLALYLGGLLATGLLMTIGSYRSGERPGGRYDLAFMGCGVLLWFVTLPIVLSVLVDLWGPREVDVEEEGMDL